jgi:hypothetical protein
VSQEVSSIKKYLARPKVLMLIVSVVLIAFTVLVACKVFSFDSDDVAWQNALQTWHPFKGKPLYWSPDTWVLKIPLYLVVSHVLSFLGQRKEVIFDSLVLAVANIMLFYVAATYFLKKIKVNLDIPSLLPIVWLASAGFSIERLFLNNNLRNIEIGISFILIMLVFKVYHNETNPLRSAYTKISSLLICLLAGLLIYNDPLFLYFIIIPVFLSLALLYINVTDKRKQIIKLFIGLVMTLIFYKAIALLGRHAGIHIIPQVVQFAAANQVFPQIANTIQSTIYVFGADFTGRNVINFITIGYLLNFLILLFVIYAIVKNLRIKSSKKVLTDESTQLKAFFSGLIIFMIVIYAISTMATPGTYRYLVFLPFISAILLSALLKDLNGNIKKLLYGVLLLSTFFNLATTASALRHPANWSGQDVKNTDEYTMIDSLEAHGLSKGYAQYWDANIDSYLSSGKLVVVPEVCSSTQISRYNWMINSSLFTKPAKKTFFIYESDIPGCTLKGVERSLGMPNSSYTVLGDDILIYNHDITSKVVN